MLNLSEVVSQYIVNTFVTEQVIVVEESFRLLELFGIKYYEDKYVDLINMSDDSTSDYLMDSFISTLREDVYSIVKEHGIVLNTDIEIRLSEVNEIVHFLYLIQNLEDYTTVSYRVHSISSSREILISLLWKYSMLSETRCLELVKSVTDDLINAIREIVSTRYEEDTITIDRKRNEYVQKFLEFTSSTPSVGSELWINKNAKNYTLEEILDMFNVNPLDNITNVTELNKVALDVLSLLVITTDDYSIPLFKFRKNTSLFTTDLELISRVTYLMTDMLNDFQDYLTAQENL